MFHCVIPRDKSNQRPLRVYTPERIASGFRRLTGSYPSNGHVPRTSGRPETSNTTPSTEPVQRKKPFQPWKNAKAKVGSNPQKYLQKLAKDAKDKSTAKPAEDTPSKPVLLKPKAFKNERSVRAAEAFQRSFTCFSKAKVGRALRKATKDVLCENSQTTFLHHTCSNADFPRFHKEIITRRVFRDLLSREFDHDWNDLILPDLEDAIYQANVSWALKLEKSLCRSLCMNNVLLSRERSAADIQEIWKKWSALDDTELLAREVQNIWPLFTLEDLAQRVTEFPSFVLLQGDLPQNGTDFWTKLPLSIPSFEDLREIYAELSPIYDHYIPDYFDQFYVEKQRQREERFKAALKLRDVFEVRKLCRSGCCTDSREAVWALLLRDKPSEKLRFRQLLSDWVKNELHADWVVLKAVSDAVGNSDQYFNFVLLVQRIFQLFQRDRHVRQRLRAGIPSKALVSSGKHSEKGSALDENYPPNGVLPFHEIGMYAAPLTYVSLKIKPAYFAFFELYTRFFQHLHGFSSHPQGVLSLYALFEHLLYGREYQLWEFLKVRMQCDLPKLVVPWLTMAFSGFMEIDQVLLLWDRIVGYNDLRILSLLAFAVFVIRKNALVKSKNVTEVTAVVADILTIEVVPLLQMVLFM